jgi:hypothetical protein
MIHSFVIINFEMLDSFYKYSERNRLFQNWQEELKDLVWSLLKPWMMGEKDWSTLGFLDNRQVRRLSEHEDNSGREHWSNCDKGEDGAWIISHLSRSMKLCESS